MSGPLYRPSLKPGGLDPYLYFPAMRNAHGVSGSILFCRFWKGDVDIIYKHLACAVDARRS